MPPRIADLLIPRIVGDLRLLLRCQLVGRHAKVVQRDVGVAGDRNAPRLQLGDDRIGGGHDRALAMVAPLKSLPRTLHHFRLDDILDLDAAVSELLGSERERRRAVADQAIR
jgi:hypothetical protein